MLQYLHCKGWLPKNITNPNDRYIRYAADRNCSDHFVDPGNVVWDILFNVLRLDQYVVSWRAEPIPRVSPSEYGAGTNKSAKGPVNLRGNVLEAALHDLQRLSAAPLGPPRGRGRDARGSR